MYIYISFFINTMNSKSEKMLCNEPLEMIDSAVDEKKEMSFLANSKPNVASEDHLQNLGLEVNDELVKFQLNEPGPAALSSSIFQQLHLVNDESEESFVVLGKTLSDSIRESSFQSYTEIQNKSEDSDHNSVISMSPIEIEENFKKVLDENVKLKETLKQNNDSIKKQFNTIQMWQKDVMTVCDNHKQKFVETKEIINRLKKENDSLRATMEQGHFNETSFAGNIINMSQNNTKDTPDSSHVGILSQQINNTQENLIQSNNEHVHRAKIESLSEESNKVHFSYSKNEEEFLQHLGTVYAYDIDSFNQQLNKVNKELEVMKQKCGFSNHIIILGELLSICNERGTELTHLKEIIGAMEQRIRKYEEHEFSVRDIQVQGTENDSKERHLLKENIEFYNTEIKELSKCFLSQYSRYLKIQEFLKESVEIIKKFENLDVLSSDLLPKDEIENYKDKLCDYRKKLFDEQMQSINNKQATMKFHQKFHKILSDYISVICELEILKDENFKITMETQNEKKMLDIDKTKLVEEEMKLKSDKMSILEDKKKIELEYNSLEVQKNELAASRISLLEEKSSLDSQNKLYELEKNTQLEENKILYNKCQDLNNELDRVKGELHEAMKLIQKGKMKENEDIIAAYKLQMELNMKDLNQLFAKEYELKNHVESLAMENLNLKKELDDLIAQKKEKCLNK